MSTMTSWIDRVFYPDFVNNWDDQLFRERILEVVDEESDVLDLGAGAGIVEAMNMKGKVRRICGIDLDPRVVDNAFLDEGIVCDANHIPYPDQSFDVVSSDNVFEHLEQPELVLKEVCRVLRPNGLLLVKTPNTAHYMPMISRLTPHRFHEFVNKLRGREPSDTFPTHYRANSSSAMHRLARKTGFVVDNVLLVEGRPEYLRFSVPTYLAGLAYEKLVNASSLFARFRILLVATLRKPG
jgi:ubiquinone/menaquinone biosynthesis C-methylase UbiE